jgi:hypothetical protein
MVIPAFPARLQEPLPRSESPDLNEFVTFISELKHQQEDLQNEINEIKREQLALSHSHITDSFEGHRGSGNEKQPISGFLTSVTEDPLVTSINKTHNKCVSTSKSVDFKSHFLPESMKISKEKFGLLKPDPSMGTS